MKRFLFVIGLIAILFGILVFNLKGSSGGNDGGLIVVTTIGQIEDIAKHIAGDKMTVSGLMGPGVDPHLYKASESDVQKLASADVILYNGLALEAKMEHIFKKMALNKVVVAVGEAVPKNQLLDSETFSGHYDPHIWFDIPIWKFAVVKVSETLSSVDPENVEYFKQRTQMYLDELDQLHKYVQKRTSEVDSSQRVLVTAHDAFRYFGKAYGFEVIGLQGISTDSKAGTGDVIRLAEFITKRKIRSIFVESSVPERNIKAVVEAVKSRGWNVQIGGELFSDAMGDAGSKEGTFVGMVHHNIDTIVDGLKGRP